MSRLFTSSYLACFVIVMIVAGWVAAVSLITQGFQKHKQNYLQSQLNMLATNIETVEKMYQRFADYIFVRTVNQPHHLLLIQQAYGADPAVQNELRLMLYDHLIDEYQLMLKYNFRQLHFQFPNGDSFLRFHAPDVYGDNLFSVRESVRIANQEQRFVFGFEEGRIFNGYRFVYPLAYENQHVGSVEVSISLTSSIQRLNELYTDRQIGVILQRDIVEDIVFGNQQNRYMLSPISDAYKVDKEVVAQIIMMKKTSLLDQEPAFLQELRSKAEAELPKKRSFTLEIIYQDKHYLVIFLQLRNINNQPVGYYVAYGTDEQLAVIKQYFIAYLFLATLICALSVGSFWIYERGKRKLQTQANLDQVTGIYNRHKFLELAAKEIARSTRYANPVSILLFDLDHFKRVNDTYGHTAGDQVLRQIGGILAASLRDIDVFARWGGEEFIVLLPETTAAQALIVAERLRRNTAEYCFGNVGQVTISIGVAERTTEEAMAQLVHNADEAMYQAKRAGRNRVVVYGSEAVVLT